MNWTPSVGAPVVPGQAGGGLESPGTKSYLHHVKKQLSTPTEESVGFFTASANFRNCRKILEQEV